MAFTSATALATQEATREMLSNIAKQFENYMCTLNPALIPALDLSTEALRAQIVTLRA